MTILGIKLLVLELPALFGIVTRQRIDGHNVWDTLWVLFTYRQQISFSSSAVSLGAVLILWAGVKYLPKIPWHMIYFVIALAMSIFLPKGSLRYTTIGAELDKDSNLETYLKQIIHLHWYNSGLLNLKQPASIQFYLNCLFMATMIIIECSAVCKISMFLTKQRHRSSAELYSVGVSNLLAGLIGILPLSLPLTRNILTLACGARTKTYTLFCLIITLILTWAFWKVFLGIPAIFKSIISTSVGLCLIDLKMLQNYIRTHRMFGFLVAVFITITLFIEITYCIIFFYVIFFAYYVQKNSNYGYSLGNFDELANKVEIFNMKFKDEQQNQLSLQEYFQSYSDLSERLRTRLKDHFLVYQFRGIFSYLFENEHLANIKITKKYVIVLDFRYVLEHDMEMLSEYLPILNRIIKSSKMELFVTGIPKHLVEESDAIRDTWVGTLQENNRLIYIS